MTAQPTSSKPTPTPQSKRAPPAKRVPDTKILRIGVIHNGRIIEERLVPAGNAVTVGEHPKCTVVIPPGAVPSKRFELFSQRGGQYTLQFTEQMHGKVSVGDQIVTLATLGKKGGAKKRGPAWALQLNDRNRGKVYVGDYTVLFQFVTPPPQPRRARSADFRAWRWEDIDWIFLAVTLLSALVHTAAVIWIESLPPPGKLRLEDFPDRFVKLSLPKESEPTETHATEEGAGEGEAEAAAPEEPAPGEGGAGADEGEESTEPVETAEERQARLEEEVSSKGLLAVFGTTGKSSRREAVADLLSDAGSLSADVGTALAGSSGVAIARHDGDQAGLRGGGGGDAAAGAGDLGGAGGGAGGTAVKDAVELKGKVDTGAAEMSSSPEDQATVSSTMKKYVGRVRQCYERELKSNPDLAGKVTVSFEISTAGTVSGVDIAGNTTGNAELGECIKNVVARIRFNPAPAADVSVGGYPFILAKQ